MPGGPIDAMNRSIASNRSMVKNIQPFSKQKKYHEAGYIKNPTHYKFRELSASERFALREKLRIQRGERRVRFSMAMLISMLIMAAILKFISEGFI
jgi:hypothetical protein